MSESQQLVVQDADQLAYRLVGVTCGSGGSPIDPFDGLLELGPHSHQGGAESLRPLVQRFPLTAFVVQAGPLVLRQRRVNTTPLFLTLRDTTCCPSDGDFRAADAQVKA